MTSMRRRTLIALPGLAALAATQAIGQTDQRGTGFPVPHISKKAIAKHSGLKSTYKVPKSAAKQTKYINSLSVLLALTAVQQEQATALFASAAATSVSLHASLKAARKALSDGIRNNDTGGISHAAAALGAMTGQHAFNGAVANAAFFQLLNPDQQAKLSQFQG